MILIIFYNFHPDRGLCKKTNRNIQHNTRGTGRVLPKKEKEEEKVYRRPSRCVENA